MYLSAIQFINEVGEEGWTVHQNNVHCWHSVLDADGRTLAMACMCTHQMPLPLFCCLLCASDAHRWLIHVVIFVCGAVIRVQVKFGAPFAEHSPILNDISELPTWGRVNEGLAKMYEAEVLGKLPVVQHLLFGSILEATWTPSRTPVPSESSSFESFGRAGQEVTASHGARDTVPEDGVAAVAPWVSQPIVSTAVQHACDICYFITVGCLSVCNSIDEAYRL